MSPDFSWPLILELMLAFIVSITVHEFGHAITAVLMGDDTPKRQGRVSLNPIDHLDPVGTVFLLVTTIMGFSFGWGKPVMTNPSNYRSPRWGDLSVSFAGPLMNLLLAAVLAVIIKNNLWGVDDSPLADLAWRTFLLNLVLFIFNLIPVPPLDGSHILADLLPSEAAVVYSRFVTRWGTLLFLPVMIGARFLIAGPEQMLVRFFGLA